MRDDSGLELQQRKCIKFLCPILASEHSVNAALQVRIISLETVLEQQCKQLSSQLEPLVTNIIPIITSSDSKMNMKQFSCHQCKIDALSCQLQGRSRNMRKDDGGK